MFIVRLLYILRFISKFFQKTLLKFLFIQSSTPVVKRQTEGGRTFTVTACQAWNSLPLSVRKLPTIKSFRNSLWKRIFKEQQLLNHFIL